MPHVYVIPTHADCLDPPICIGEAQSLDRAIALAAVEGYDVISEDEGGCHEIYDYDDGPHIFGYTSDNRGVIGITIRP